MPVEMFHYNTGSNSQKASKLTVYPGTTIAPYTIIFRVPVWCELGDILDVAAEQQFTNPYLPYNAGCWSHLVLSPTREAPPPTSSTSFIEIAEANGRNIVPALHHDTHTKVGTYVITPTDVGQRWVMLCAYSKHDNAKTDQSEKLNVDADYGRMSVFLTRGAVNIENDGTW